MLGVVAKHVCSDGDPLMGLLNRWSSGHSSDVRNVSRIYHHDRHLRDSCSCDGGRAMLQV